MSTITRTLDYRRRIRTSSLEDPTRSARNVTGDRSSPRLAWHLRAGQDAWRPSERETVRDIRESDKNESGKQWARSKRTKPLKRGP